MPIRTRPSVKKQESITHVAMVLDASGSMDRLRDPALQAFNQMIRDIKTQAHKNGLDMTVTLILIDDVPKLLYAGKNVKAVTELTYSDYRPNGGTPLFDSIGRAVEELEGLPRRVNTGYLVLCVTDGLENVSSVYGSVNNPAPFIRLISDCQDTDEFTFTFQLPPRHANSFSREYGIPRENCREWEQTEAGTRDMEVATSGGIDLYSQARSKGTTSLENFYTDLSGVTTNTIKRNLTDLSSHFKTVTADKEVSVSSLVEYKTGQPYVTGASYYQLMKKELVQKDKQVLIREKGKNEVWGGKEARSLVGIPDGVDAKVEPGNHAMYDIFVQSRSHNRKIPRGTKVLVDLQQKKGLSPTWTA